MQPTHLLPKWHNIAQWTIKWMEMVLHIIIAACGFVTQQNSRQATARNVVDLTVTRFQPVYQTRLVVRSRDNCVTRSVQTNEHMPFSLFNLVRMSSLPCPVLGEPSLSSVHPSRSAPWGCRVRSALCYCALCLVTVVCPSVQECSVGMSCKVCPVLPCPVLGEQSVVCPAVQECSVGMSWREENDLKRALYASLNESRCASTAAAKSSADPEASEGTGEGEGELDLMSPPSPKAAAPGAAAGEVSTNGSSTSNNGEVKGCVNAVLI